MGIEKASGSKSEGTQQKPLDPKVNERRGGTRLLLKHAGRETREILAQRKASS